MAYNEKEFIKTLEEVVSRLEEAVTDKITLSDMDELPYDDRDYRVDADMEDSIEQAEAALLLAENRMEEIKQVLREEIENLRQLLEGMEEDPD